MSKESQEVDNYDIKLPAALEFAKPMASKKLNKKVLKSVKKASKTKQARRGVKEVVKALRKGEKGVVIIAGDIWPMDVISHIPVLCEDSKVPYVFIPSKEDLGHAGSTKRPTSCVMVTPSTSAAAQAQSSKDKERLEDFKESFDEVFKEIEEL